jgi:beta-lactamase class A
VAKRLVGGLLAGCLVVACVAGLLLVAHPDVGAARPSSAAPASPSPSPTPTVAVLPPLYGGPSASPFEMVAGRRAWTNQAVALVAHPGEGGTPTVHLGAGYPLTWLSGHVQADGQDWDQVVWRSPSRHGEGWLPASAIALSDPGIPATAGLDALSLDLEDYAEAQAEKLGVGVFDADDGITYGYNEDHQYLMASSVKVAIMCTFLSQIEKQGREPTPHERSLLDSMIRFSSNDSAQDLWDQTGDQKAMRAFLKSAGITGITPASNYNGWGYSSASPLGMVSLLRALHEGTILTPEHRALALGLMSRITPEQQVGVGDSSPAGAKVAMKDGWYPVTDGSGWLMNSSGIVEVGDRTYILSVYTDRNRNLTVGKKIVRRVCYLVGVSMVAPEAAGEGR